MLEIVSRKAWGAMPNQWYISPVEHPAISVFVFYTGHTEACYDREKCDPMIRDLQMYHIEEKRNMPDFPYSFLVADSGLVYEGRGWAVSVPEPFDRKDLRNKRYIIAYIANDFQLPGTAAEKTVNELIEYGIKHNYIIKNYEKYEWKMSNMSEETRKKWEKQKAERQKKMEAGDYMEFNTGPDLENESP